jgi:hypothetical protein
MITEQSILLSEVLMPSTVHSLFIKLSGLPFEIVQRGVDVAMVIDMIAHEKPDASVPHSAWVELPGMNKDEFVYTPRPNWEALMQDGINHDYVTHFIIVGEMVAVWGVYGNAMSSFGDPDYKLNDKVEKFI